MADCQAVLIFWVNISFIKKLLFVAYSILLGCCVL
jgi:hypothetical protein